MTYRLFGAELSPYSVKVRSYLRYKGVAHKWIVRSQRNNAAYKKYAKLPLIPLLVSAEGEAAQDSTPIILNFEKQEDVLSPKGSVAPFVSALLEEYGDEWGNKWMFHYRWWYPENGDSAAYRIAEMQVPAAFWAHLPIVKQMLKKKIAAFIKQRMVPRLSFVGSNEETKEQIENSLLNACQMIDKHLEHRPYLFGARPSLGDLGLWCQFYVLWTDPTPKRIISAYPNLRDWIKDMLNPSNKGDWEDWDSLAPTLTPFLSEEVAKMFLPWSHANAKALAAGEKEFSVALKGKSFKQETQKYHARSLKVICESYQQHKNAELDAVLTQTGCLEFLNA
jgi:glutathione S-transferase